MPACSVSFGSQEQQAYSVIKWLLYSLGGEAGEGREEITSPSPLSPSSPPTGA